MSMRMEDPSNFNNDIDVFQNYNKSLNRWIPSTGQGDIKPGSTSIFTAPIGSFDWDTFRLQFEAFTEGDSTHIVGFPQHMACMIEQLDIIINGTNVQHIPYYGFVYKTMKDYNISFEDALKKVATNPDPSVYTTMDHTGAVTRYNRYVYANGIDAVNKFTDEYVIDDWIGFIKTCRPRIWNTNIVGTMEIHIKWASGAVLWGTAGSTFDYTISNLYAYVDKLDWKDTEYFDYIEKQLSSGDGFKIPYKNYRVHLGTALDNAKASTTRFTESTESLDKIIFTFLHGARNTNSILQLGTPADVLPTFNGGDVAGINNQLNASFTTVSKTPPKDYNYQVLKAKNDPHLLNTSQYFRRNGLGMKGATVQFEINSQDLPTQPLSLVSQYEETLKTFELNADNINKINPGITDLVRYEKDFYCCALSTSHINDKRPDFLISGKNTQATSMNVAVKVVGGRTADPAQACQPIVITEMSAVLIVKPGRSVQVKF
jgi:hypothetical protein